MAEKNLFGGSEREYPHPTVEEKSGLGSLVEGFFGGNAGAASGSMDPNAGKTYYPPTTVDQTGMYFDYPEAKQVVGPRQYVGEQPNTWRPATHMVTHEGLSGPFEMKNRIGGLGLTRTIEDQIAWISKMWRIVSDDDKEWIQMAQFALEDQLPWK